MEWTKEIDMKCISTQDAVGLALCHDITEIRPGNCKKVAFARGHIVKEEDIEHLLRIGKENLYIWEDSEGLVHEDDAAYRIAKAISGDNIEYTSPQEGKISLKATVQGLLKINLPLLDRLNSIPDVTIATSHTMQEVQASKVVAGTRVIPLVVSETSLKAVEECCNTTSEPLISVVPFKSLKIGLVVTGSEVFYGRIQDAFTPVLQKKFAAWNSEIVARKVTSDETEMTIKAIEDVLAEGVDFVAVTGGMSVDPDDKTPAAIKHVAEEVITYGAPIFPGAMFMLAYMGNVPIVGLPGCVMYHRASIFDIVMPWLLAGMRVTKHDILKLAHGGLCENCEVCRYPICSFGKGTF